MKKPIIGNRNAASDIGPPQDGRTTVSSRHRQRKYDQQRGGAQANEQHPQPVKVAQHDACGKSTKCD